MQGAAGDLHSVLLAQQLFLDIGADGLGVILPVAGGALKVVGGVGELQLAVVQLLAQLHDGGVVGGAHGGGAHIADGGGKGLVAGDVDIVHLAAGGDDVAVGVDEVQGVAVRLHHAGLQGVQRHLRHLITGQGGVDGGVHAVEQADLVGLQHGGGLKAGGVVALVLEVAQGAHQHRGGLHGGHGGAGVVHALAAAGHDAVGVAGANPAPRPVVDVVKGADCFVVVIIQVQQLAHDNRHLGAVDGTLRAKAPLVAHHHLDGLQNLDRFDVVGFRDIVIARSRAGTDDHHAKQHDRGQSQAEGPLQVSHSDFLL